MNQQRIIAWLCILLLQALLASACVAADQMPRDVSQKEVKQYWRPAQEDIAPKMPPLVRAVFELVDKHGRVVLDYEVTINEKGVPVDFKFKSITPAHVDPKPFIASVMFYRYRPTPQNSARRPVRVHGPKPYFIPKK